jgi:hypothetical protein
MKSTGYGLVFLAGAAIYCAAFFQQLGHTLQPDLHWVAFFIGLIVMLISGLFLILDNRNAGNIGK